MANELSNPSAVLCACPPMVAIIMPEVLASIRQFSPVEPASLAARHNSCCLIQNRPTQTCSDRGEHYAPLARYKLVASAREKRSARTLSC
ncbi:unnamed protein product [Gemmata massiliana]|uniref:Uncharacterized protein n=1 Tax=Gemmata massiliana TaxID=1210884 RepID=A0A6P2DHL8_9BACT|nr:unnamed protein product [Gemmata massiliana]